uniref:receptor-like protein EIX2 isoform X1 n=1 Tax=Erigeron canadensis TaxID=72917 RepID=UPI001CB98220|nr:receptor-like protein EIX2 isoform X1 [Erigeron canadensis]
MGPQFPNWLQTQTHLEDLDLSNSSIRDTIPEWFQNISSHLRILDLSDNEIHGNLPRIIANNNTGNNGLCGLLLRSCETNNKSNTHVGDNEGENGIKGFSWFYAGMIPGFVVGFMGLFVSFHYIRIWRVVYFEMIENVYTFLTISIIMTFARLRKKFF